MPVVDSARTQEWHTDYESLHWLALQKQTYSLPLNWMQTLTKTEPGPSHQALSREQLSRAVCQAPNRWLLVEHRHSMFIEYVYGNEKLAGLAAWLPKHPSVLMASLREYIYVQAITI